MPMVSSSGFISSISAVRRPTSLGQVADEDRVLQRLPVRQGDLMHAA
jgi:hypothetical protein